jgi:phosphohistidine phosphatase SixA
MKWQLCVACIAAVPMLASCGSTAPREEIKLFADSFKAANDAGQPLLDDLAAAERAQGKVNAERRARGAEPVSLADEESATPVSEALPAAGEEPAATAASADIGCPPDEVAWRNVGGSLGFIDGYCMADARYFADVGDPPATHSFRQGLAIIGKYADVLTALAEGRNLEEVHAQLDSLSGSIAGLASFVPGGAAAVPAIGPALSALQPLIDAAAQASNDREVRRLVAEGAGPAKDLIQALQDATPEIFATLISRSHEAATSREARDTPAIAQPEVEHIEAYRATVSNFVVLLEEIKNALDEVVVAAENPDRAVSLQSLADQAARLRIYADAVRKAYAELRRG